MGFIRRLFRKGSEGPRRDPYWGVIKRMIKDKNLEFTFDRMYYFGGKSVRSQEEVDEFIRAINSCDFSYLNQLGAADYTKDTVEAFLVVNEENDALLMGLFSPFEIFEDDWLLAYSRSKLPAGEMLEGKSRPEFDGQ